MRQMIFSRLSGSTIFPDGFLAERYQQVILRIIATAGITLSVVLYTIAETMGQIHTPYSIIPYVSFLFLFGLPWISKYENLRIAIQLLIFSLFIALSVSAYFTGGILSPSFASLLILIVFTGLVVNIKNAVVLTALYMTSGMLYAFTDIMNSHTSMMISGSSNSTMCTQATYLIGGLLIIYVIIFRAGREGTETITETDVRNGIYQNLLKSDSHTFFAYDREHRITEWNTGMEKFTGVLADKALGKAASELVPSVIERCDETMLTEILNTRAPSTREFHYIYAETQEELQFEAHSYPLINEFGDIAGGLVVLQEAEDHKNTIANYPEIDEKFHLVAQITSDAIIVVKEDGEIVFWNQAAEEIFKYSEDDVLGKPFTMLVPDAHVARLGKELHRLRVEDGAGFHVQNREGFAKRNGQEEFPVKLSLDTWKFGEQIFICVVIRDATEEKDLQRRLLFQEQLGTIGSLAAGVAHDFNNALMPISLHTEMLLKERSLDEAIKRVLEIIQGQTKRAGELSKQLLAFSRQNQEKMQRDDLKRTLQELEQLLLRTLPENILMSFQYSPGSFMFHGDTNRLQQAFLNMTINARDAMPEGGGLLVRLSQRTIAPEDPPPFLGMPAGDWIRLDIADTGEGIPAEHLPRIFEPFFTTKDEGEGYGLGLAQTYNIVKQHNGYIDVVSRLGKGTTFTIYLPSIREGDELDQEDSNMEMILNGEKETILLVEDDRLSLEAVCETLEFLNYKVVAVPNGTQALDVFKKDRIQLVISDMVMPDMNGIELHSALLDLDPNLRMVIITGYPMEEIHPDIIKRGVVGLIRKPTDMTTLSQTIRNALSTEISPDIIN
jgi:PAS domain S-box-containing protein